MRDFVQELKAEGFSLPELSGADVAQMYIEAGHGEAADADYLIGIAAHHLVLAQSVKPKIALVGEDGNIFSIAGRAGRALKRAGQYDKAKELYERLPKCESYEAAVMLVLEYVDEE